MSNQLLPCPCCGGKPMEMQYDGTLWVQCEDCALNTAACDASADYVQLWNRRATQPAAGEPVYQWRDDQNQRWWTTSKADYEWILENRPGCQARILWTAQPAAAHGDEAVRKDAERYRWLRERDLDAISAGGVFAGMTPQNLVLNLEDLDEAIDAAMRAQGDGEVQ